MSPVREEMEDLDERLSSDDLLQAWSLLAHEDRMEGFRLLDRADAEDFFLALSSRDQAELLLALAAGASAARGCACCRPTTPPT